MSTQKLSDEAKKVWENYFGDKDKGTDYRGNLICKAAYNDENSEYGWDIDHVNPKSRGGSNNIKNLKPLLISENRKKGNSWDI